jgi:hypothetical protein
LQDGEKHEQLMFFDDLKMETVTLHWANKDQYYIKTDLWLNNYVFDAGAYKVVFEISRADTSVNTANEKELERSPQTDGDD